MPNGLLSTFFLSPHRLCLSLVICSLRVLHFVARSFLYVLLIFRLFSFFLVIRVFNCFRVILPLLYSNWLGLIILLRRDVVVPKCPHSELLLEVTTLWPVRPRFCLIRRQCSSTFTLWTQDLTLLSSVCLCFLNWLSYLVDSPEWYINQVCFRYILELFWFENFMSTVDNSLGYGGSPVVYLRPHCWSSKV